MQPIFLDYLVFSIYSSYLPIIFKLFLQVYDYMEQNKTFVFSHTLSDIIWGGSDTCQVTWRNLISTQMLKEICYSCTNEA